MVLVSSAMLPSKLMLVGMAEAVIRLVIEIVFVFPASIFASLASIFRPSSYKRKTFSSIFITGASSGLGAALAKSFAKPGVRLVLAARRLDKLEAVRKCCEALGADTVVAELDVTDIDAVNRTIREMDNKLPLDLVIANAGVAREILPNKLDLVHSTNSVLQVNVNGCLATVTAAINAMVRRKQGQIVIMGSVAGFCPTPIEIVGDPVYNASKAAVRYYGEIMRPLLKCHNVGLTVLAPGFVASGDIVENWSNGNANILPFVVSEEFAVKIMKDSIERNVGVTVFPFIIRKLCVTLAGLPPHLRTAINGIFKLPFSG